MKSEISEGSRSSRREKLRMETIVLQSRARTQMQGYSFSRQEEPLPSTWSSPHPMLILLHFISEKGTSQFFAAVPRPRDHTRSGKYSSWHGSQELARQAYCANVAGREESHCAVAQP